ncbi:MAG: PDZ domain-containing protein [Nitrosopumilus sp. H8]|nr:MAG: PDZ domain-containing protein [Nitrosopumilus sp. H8]
MDRADMATGMTVAGIIAVAVFAVIFVIPSESDRPPLVASNGHPSAVGETTPLRTADLSLVEIFEMSEPGVVRVNVKKIGDMESGRGVGSGFVYDTRGHIATNSHVIDDAERVTVTFLDGRSYDAEVVGADEFTDLAILRADVRTDLLHPLSIGDSSRLKVGEAIAAIGNPFGLSGSMTSGIISQLGRLLPSDSGYSIPDVIQTDAAINPGNSGGPLLNMRGEVVGINTAIQSTTGEFTGVGFAVPSQTILKIIPTLIGSGEYEHPWIGISGRDIDTDLARALGVDDAVGFLIVTVIDDSPASRAGLVGSNGTMTIDDSTWPVGGDIILGVDGIEVRQIDDILIHLQRSKAVGDEMTVEILRDGEIIHATITLQERPNGN